MKHKLLLADEGNSKVHLLNTENVSERWSRSCPNRDMQLIGKGRLMVSTNGGKGFSILDCTSGEIVREVNVAGVNSGVNSAFLLSDEAIYCACDGSPAKIFRIDSTGGIQTTITLAMDASVRICRPTSERTFLVGGKVAGMVYEFDPTGNKIWECNAGGEPYMAIRSKNGTTLISNGYGGQMVLADESGNVIKKFPTQNDKNVNPSFWTEANPNFFAGFQILRNGNIIVSNWQGHGPGNGNSGYQLLEFDSSLSEVVACWKQDASVVSSLHGVLVLDDLDLDFAYTDMNGILQPIIEPVGISVFRRNGTIFPAGVGSDDVRIYVDLKGRLRTAASYKTHGCYLGASVSEKAGLHVIRQIMLP